MVSFVCNASINVKLMRVRPGIGRVCEGNSLPTFSSIRVLRNKV